MWRPGDEPIPGYCLEQFLGRGNYGEVWRSRAPGGTSAALKFLDLSGKNGLREFRGVERVKGIKHANLMPITAIWMLDDTGEVVDDRQLQEYAPEANAVGETEDAATETLAVRKSRPRSGCLVVAMLTGDKNLGERLEECQEEGLPGIPVDELLGYMEEAAKGIDRLNLYEHDLGDGPKRIQHCDIKPANMMLVGGAVLVCDFGLAQVLGDTHVTQSITGSPAFMAPECFEADGASSNRDQYALAIAFHELRTGALPFDDESYAAVCEAHKQGKLNLSRLPPAEQAVIRRATSTRPEDRYPSSAAMAQALRQAVHPTAPSVMAGQPKRTKSIAAVLVGVLAAAAFFFWRSGSPPESIELSFVPADCQVQIDGVQQALQAGTLQIPLDPDQPVRIQSSHDSHLYEDIDREFSIDELESLGYRVQLQRYGELRFDPTDAVVYVDGIRRPLVDGTLKLILDGRTSMRIAVSHSGGMYQDLDGTYSMETLRQQDFQIALARSWQYHEDAAFRLFDAGDFAGACAEFRAAVALGCDTTVPVVDMAQQTAGAVRWLKISPGGRWLVAASNSANTVHLWNLRGTDPAAKSYLLRAHDDIVQCAEFCRDDRRLVTAGRDKTIRLWDLSGPSPSDHPRTVGQHDRDVVSLALGPDDRWVASADFAGTIQLWNLDDEHSGQPLVTLQQDLEIREIGSDRDGRWLTALSEEGRLYRWSLARLSAAEVEATSRMLSGPDVEIKCGVMAPDGQRFVGGATGGSLLLWDMETDPNSPVHVRTAHSDDIESLAISLDGKYLITGSSDHEVRLWDLASALQGEPRTLLGHDQLVSAVSIGGPGSRWVATGSWDKTIRIWDSEAPNPAARPIVLEQLADRVRMVAMSPDGRWLVACGNDGAALLWDLRRLLLVRRSG